MPKTAPVSNSIGYLDLNPISRLPLPTIECLCDLHLCRAQRTRNQARSKTKRMPPYLCVSDQIATVALSLADDAVSISIPVPGIFRIDASSIVAES
jgi:hypothetical protein